MSWNDYATAVVRLYLPTGPVIVAPQPAGTVKGAFPAELGAGPAVVVTAYNPHGELASESVNRRAHVALTDRLDREGRIWFPAVGGDPSWTHTEESVIMPGLSPAEARDLGRELGQDAVFVWDTVGWSIHSCTHDHRVTLGWAIKPAPAEVVDLAAAVTRLGLPSEYVTLIEASTALDRALAQAPQDADALERAYSLVAQDFWRRSDRLARLSRERVAAAEATRLAPQRERARQARAARRELARQAKEAESELARQAKEAERLQHEGDVAAGWPPSWESTAVQRWSGLGGTVAQAAEFAAAGWAASETLAAAKAFGTADGLRTPPGGSGHHFPFGDRLIDLLRGEPILPDGQVLSLEKTFLSGRRERWLVAADQGAVTVTRWVNGAQGWAMRAESHSADPAAAFAANPGLRTVRAGTISEYTLSPSLPAAKVMGWIRLATSSSKDAPGRRCSDEQAREWLDEDATVSQILDGTPHVLPWCRIDRLRVAAVRPGRRWAPVLIDMDEQEVVSGREFARFTWFSESGGAPVSWDGGNSLALVGDALIQVRQWGDMGSAMTWRAVPRQPSGLADLVASWVTQVGGVLAAALMLEPLSPFADWDEMFEEVTFDLWFDLDDSTMAKVRRRLATTSSSYRAVRKALAQPRSAVGKRLASALRDAQESGVTGELMWGGWADAT
jgi:hypothetical protein